MPADMSQPADRSRRHGPAVLPPGPWRLLLIVSAVGLAACSYNAARYPSEPQQSLLRLPATPEPAPVVPREGAAADEAHTPSPARPGSRQGQSIARLAEQMIGVPYVWGGRSPRGFDCSGLVYYTHRRHGVSVPRTSRAQYRAARRISLEQARPGDLLFFRSSNMSHVGIYVGNGEFVHAPSRGKRVSVARVSSRYYRARLVAVGRLHGL